MGAKWIAAAILAGVCAAPSVAQDHGHHNDADDRLSRTIHEAFDAEGPWLLPAEQALIARKCGDAPSDPARDGVTMRDNVLICSNGRRVENDREVIAMMEVAGERISRRVHAVMDSPAVRNAISAVSEEAVKEAMQSVQRALRHLER